MAFALAPELPVSDWLADIDGTIGRSAGFFAGRPAVLDLAGLTLAPAEVAALIRELEGRGIRIMGLEGAEAAAYGPDLPPVLTSGRVLTAVDTAPVKAPFSWPNNSDSRSWSGIAAQLTEMNGPRDRLERAWT